MRLKVPTTQQKLVSVSGMTFEFRGQQTFLHPKEIKHLQPFNEMSPCLFNYTRYSFLTTKPNAFPLLLLSSLVVKVSYFSISTTCHLIKRKRRNNEFRLAQRLEILVFFLSWELFFDCVISTNRKQTFSESISHKHCLDAILRPEY